ncbi:MAG: hypothetical protein MZV64_65020 [Ignavibacteriales bacterium]|nr:hypothetical protein [Ignavibacteriales bacterium]
MYNSILTVKKVAINKTEIPQQELKEKINKILYEVNKPSRYTGGEIGSLYKDWNKALVKTIIAFPDMYEIGISNLGHRLLYHIINNISDEFLADRTYAPNTDFKDKLAENNIPLYGVESFKSLKEFDVIAFSLQYELSYPTILTMLEMGEVNYKSAQRKENEPIVIAGGPGSYNPESMTDFIDAFIIGDGEEVIVEILQSVKSSKELNLSREETLKNLQKLEGVYVPRFYETDGGFSKPVPVSEEFPKLINKRISELKDENYPDSFPVPYLSNRS